MRVSPATFGAKEDQGSLTIFGKGNKLKVTRFQRTYTWEESQWELLKNDITYMAGEDEFVAWPSLILQEIRDPGLPDHRIYWIGDGQQRITTVYVCLLAIWQSARERFERVEGEGSWVDDLLPDPRRDRPITYGVLGDVIKGVYKPVIDPKLNFSSEAIQEDIKLLVRPLEEGDWLTIDNRIQGTDEASGLFRAFRYFYEWAESYEVAELERFVELIFSHIKLSAVVFEASENMERAYGNMNSGGRPLTEDELVKARIYGQLKLHHSEELADEMADWWIQEFESSMWWREKGKTSRARADGSTRVYSFLEEKYSLENRWEIEAARNAEDSRKKYSAHWLSSVWSEYLRKYEGDRAGIEAFWNDFKTDKENFELIRGRNVGAYPKGGNKWLASYAYTVFTLPSVLMYLLRTVSDEAELKEILWLFIRYSMFLQVVGNENNFIQILIKSGSPLRADRPATYGEYLSWFLKTEKKARWTSEDEITKRLTERDFKNSMNVVLTRLFIYVNNRKAEDTRNRESLFSRDAESLDPTKSREHILSQKPKGYEGWSEQLRKAHDEIVGLLGNTLIISSTKNSELQNRPVFEKLPTYRSEANSLVGTFWVQDFLDDYADAGSWGRDEILARSTKLAKEIAPYLAHPVLFEADGEATDQASLEVDQ